MLEDRGLLEEVNKNVRNWRIFDSGRFADNLYEVPHDALIVMGSYGHGLVKDFLFGSTMEMVQSIMPNPLLIVGHRYRPSVA